MRRVVATLSSGAIDVIRSPLLIAGAIVITLAATAPFALIVGDRLREALANQPPIALGSGEIDADWWSEFRAHATGLAATFTPTVIGFAAPLDNLSALLDGTPRPWSLLAPIAVAMLAWSWFWGIALTRFAGQRPRSFRAAWAAGFAHLPRLVVISVAAAAVQLLLYLTVHPVLFRLIFERSIGEATPEPTAFAIRVVLYVVFGLLIASVSLVADYTRIIQIVDRPATVIEMLRTGVRFVGRHYAAVLSLFMLTGLLFVILLAAYGTIDIYGGARVRGWRGVVLAQAYIIGRLIIRLTFAASEMRLFHSTRI
jgi:hypothetical protein